MARQPDTPCAGDCGKLLWSGRGNLPAGQRMCRECRRKPKLGRHCPTCGNPLSLRGKIYCSRTCANRGKPGRRGKPPVPLRACEICGKQFKRKRSDREGYTQRTCSRACGVTLRKTVTRTLAEPKAPASKVYIRNCAWCGVLFVARDVRTRGCSPDHRRKLGWVSDKRRVHKMERHCPCGKQIPLKRQKCDDCRLSEREMRRQSRHRRRARERGAARESYLFAYIAARDRYRCGICHKRVAMTKEVPHPKAPTIDHIVPISKGGEDTAANVRLAHFICNSIRGDRMGYEQVALFG